MMSLPPTLNLWQEMLQRLQLQGTEISDVADCSTTVLAELLGELGFNALQKAKLQTEWVKRTATQLTPDNNIQIMQSLVPEHIKIVRVDRIENDYLQELFVNNIRVSGTTPVGLWYHPSRQDDTLCAARVGFSLPSIGEPLCFSDIPPSCHSNRILFCDVCSVDPYNVRHIEECIPRLLVTIREVGGRLSPPPVPVHSPEVIGNRLTHGIISPSLASIDRAGSPVAAIAAAEAEAMRLQFDLLSLPHHMRIEPSPSISQHQTLNHATVDSAVAKEQTLRLLSETDRLMAELHKPLIYNETNPPIGWMQAQQAMEEAEGLERRKRQEELTKQRREEEAERRNVQEEQERARNKVQQEGEEHQPQPNPECDPSKDPNTDNVEEEVPVKDSAVATLFRELDNNRRLSIADAEPIQNPARSTQELRREMRNSQTAPVPQSHTAGGLNENEFISNAAKEAMTRQSRTSLTSGILKDGHTTKNSTIVTDESQRYSLSSASDVLKEGNATTEAPAGQSRNSLGNSLKYNTSNRNSVASEEQRTNETARQSRSSLASGHRDQSDRYSTGEELTGQGSTVRSTRNTEELRGQSRSSLASGTRDDKRHSVHIGSTTKADSDPSLGSNPKTDVVVDNAEPDQHTLNTTTARSSLVGSVRQVRVSLPEVTEMTLSNIRTVRDTVEVPADARLALAAESENINSNASNNSESGTQNRNREIPEQLSEKSDQLPSSKQSLGGTSDVLQNQIKKLQVVDDPNAGIRFSTLQPASRTASVCTSHDEREVCLDTQILNTSLKQQIADKQQLTPIEGTPIRPQETDDVRRSVEGAANFTLLPAASNTSNASNTEHNLHDASQQTLPMAQPAPGSLHSTASSVSFAKRATNSVQAFDQTVTSASSSAPAAVEVPPQQMKELTRIGVELRNTIDTNLTPSIPVSGVKKVASDVPKRQTLPIGAAEDPTFPVVNRFRNDSITSAFRDGADDIRRHLENGDVVQVAVSEPCKMLPRPPSPTPKLNPIAVREEVEETVMERAEETRKQEEDDWEVRVKEALSRVSTISSGIGKKSQQEKDSFGTTLRQRAKLSSTASVPARVKTPSSPISISHPAYGLPSPEHNTSRVISPEREGSLAMAGRCRAEQAADLTRNLLGNNLRDWVSTAEASSVLGSGQLPSIGGIESFEETLQKIELSAKTDFDAVTNKLEALKGKMDATRQSWMSVRPQHSGKSRWVGADLPGGVWGPAFSELQDEYARALEATVESM